MPQTAYDAYLESRIDSAAPLQLVRLLYQGAMDAVRTARRQLAAGDIAGRSRAISRAFEILVELNGALDPARGGEIAGRLARLYDYMERRLLEGNARQIDEPLAEVLGLLSTLEEAWQAIAEPALQPTAARESGPWAHAAAAEAGAAAHAWSA
jgi:flagellar protein FliS